MSDAPLEVFELISRAIEIDPRVTKWFLTLMANIVTKSCDFRSFVETSC